MARLSHGKYLSILALAGLLWTTVSVSQSHAQGLLVNVQPGERVRLPRPHPDRRPAPPAGYQIKELDVRARLLDQVAKVQVSQTFVNTGSTQMEVCFMFPLPYDGAIDQLTLLVDGKEYPAKLLPKDQARSIYESIVRKNQDPALLEWMGTGMFQTSVFPVPPGAQRKVTLRYSQLCRKMHGLTDFLFPLSTARYTSRPVEKLNVEVTIESSDDIKNVYSPTHAVSVTREGKRATVSLTAENQVPISDFRLFYDVEAGKLTTRVLSYRPKPDDEGYFLLLASPKIEKNDAERPKKTVVFVVDRSGSMSGEKIEQAKEALKFVLNKLREGDLFNIVAYDSSVESFRPELQKFDEQTRQAALGFVDGLYAGGSTHIDGALAAALGQLVDSSRPSYVLFLTDGLPTAGETNEMKIVANAKAANQVRARVVAFGVGYDVNSRLLDKLARANFGQSEYVRPDENIEQRVSMLFNRIESPVMTDVAIRFDVEGAGDQSAAAVNRLYPKEVHDLFEGEQLVLVGRYKKHGTAKVTVTGSTSGRQQSFDFPAQLVERSTDDTFAFIEKLWAQRRIGEIIDELDLVGKNDELIKELVDLSTRHGILTPYTSFLADENVSLGDLAGNARQAETRLDRLSVTSGRDGFSQREAKAGLQRAAQVGGARGGAGFGGVPAASPGRSRGAAGQGQGAGRDELAEVPADEAVRQVGAKSFYRRGKRWVDSTVTDELEKKARRIEQFSDEYFELAERHGRKLSQYLAFDEAVLLNLDGAIYLVEPANP
ncbi:MAG: VIT domain-containing protein [Pirellulales bacterium]